MAYDRYVDPELEKLYRQMVKEFFEIDTYKYSKIMGVTYNKITIRDQRTRWGSCSSNGNISYNWRVIFMHPMIGRYIIVHELAHRKHMNHSKEFWAEVARVMPDYRKYKAELKRVGYQYIRRT